MQFLIAVHNQSTRTVGIYVIHLYHTELAEHFQIEILSGLKAGSFVSSGREASKQPEGSVVTQKAEENASNIQ